MKLLILLRGLASQLRSQGLRLTLLAGLDKFWRKITGHPLWHFIRITPEILLGGQPARRLLRHLHAHGVTGVINLRKEYDYAREMGNQASLRYLYLPTVDNTAPSLEHLYEGVRFIREELSKGGSVYVHCWEGLGRSPTMVAAYLVSTGLSAQEAWANIRAVRPFIRPNAAQQAQLEAFIHFVPPRVTSETPPAEVQGVEVDPVQPVLSLPSN